VLVGAAEGEGFGRFPPTHRYDTCDTLSGLVRRIGDTISVQAPNGTGADD